MPSNATTAASFPRRNRSMDQAMKAGIGATACSVLILVIVLLAMHTVPLTAPMPPRVDVWAGELVGLLRKLA